MRKTEPYYTNESEYANNHVYCWSKLRENEKSVIKKPTMAIHDIKYMPKGKICLDISSEEGCGLYLVGYAKKLAPQLGMNTNEIIVEMTNEDYPTLLRVFDKYFGEIVDLYK